MRAFLSSLAAALLIAVIAAFALNGLDMSTAAVQKAPASVRLN